MSGPELGLQHGLPPEKEERRKEGKKKRKRKENMHTYELPEPGMVCIPVILAFRSLRQENTSSELP